MIDGSRRTADPNLLGSLSALPYLDPPLARLVWFSAASRLLGNTNARSLSVSLGFPIEGTLRVHGRDQDGLTSEGGAPCVVMLKVIGLA